MSKLTNYQEINDKYIDLKKKLIAIRHHFHQYPELSNQEVQTTKYLKELLLQHNIEVLDLPLKTGLVAQIKGKNEGPIVALRGDIDALPIIEKSEVSYQSTVPGVMHACGHDFHMTSILGAAILLQQQQDKLAGTVKFVFQPAEETGHGAPLIIDTKVLDDVNVIFGIHNDPTLAAGSIGTKSGALTAAVDRFEIKIKTKGCHGARPHEGSDPAMLIASLLNSFQTIVSRNLSPNTHAVLSVTQIHCGTTWNIISDNAYLEGTVRTFDAENRKLIKERMAQIIEGIKLSFNAEQILFIWHDGHPSVINTPEWVDLALIVGNRVGFNAHIISEMPIGEDFSFYQEILPGAFMMIGTGTQYPLHHPKFCVNDDVLLPSSYYLAELIKDSISSINYKLNR